jgi:hypothetical protein
MGNKKIRRHEGGSSLFPWFRNQKSLERAKSTSKAVLYYFIVAIVVLIDYSPLNLHYLCSFYQEGGEKT